MSSFNLEITLELLQKQTQALDVTYPTLERLRFITTNLKIYPVFNRGGGVGMSTWDSQFDPTVHLSKFETEAFSVSRDLFFLPRLAWLTLDDDMLGTRATDNPNVSLSSRKADKEGHCADVLCEALSRAITGIRFRRKGVSQDANVSQLFNANLSGSGSVSLRGVKICNDRGYSKTKNVINRAESGIGGVSIMPDHLNNCHPFVAKSRLSHRSERFFDDDESDDNAPASEDASEHDGTTPQSNSTVRST